MYLKLSKWFFVLLFVAGLVELGLTRFEVAVPELLGVAYLLLYWFWISLVLFEGWLLRSILTEETMGSDALVGLIVMAVILWLAIFTILSAFLIFVLNVSVVVGAPVVLFAAIMTTVGIVLLSMIDVGRLFFNQ